MEHSLMSASAAAHKNSALIYTGHSDLVVGWNYHYQVYTRKDSSAVNLNLSNLKDGLLITTKPTEASWYFINDFDLKQLKQKNKTQVAECFL